MNKEIIKIKDKPKILLIEDDKDFQKLIESMLKEFCQPILASSGKEALKVFDSSFQAVLMDYILPDTNGCLLAKELSKLHSCPIVLMTAYKKHDLPIEEIPLFMEILTKPFEEKELLSVLYRALYYYRQKGKPEGLAELLVDNALEGIFTINQEGIILSWNQRASELLGYSAEEVLEQPFFFLFGRDSLGKSLLKLLQADSLFAKEIRLFHKQGRPLSVYLSAKPLSLGANQKSYFVGFVDITDLETTRQDLSKTTTRFKTITKQHTRLLQNFLHMHLMIVDEKKQVLSYAPSFPKLFQKQVDSEKTLYARDFLPPHLEKLLDSALEGNYQIFEGNLEEGKDKIYRIVFDPVLENKQILGALILCEDIKELNKTIEQRILAEKRGLLQMLAEGISHEYNNILTSIQGYAELILNRTQDPNLREYSEFIVQSVERASSLTEQLRALVDKQSFFVHSFEMDRMIQKFLDDCKQDFLSLVPEVQISFCSSFTPFKWKGDPFKVQKILEEVLENSVHAVKDSSQKEIHLRLLEHEGHPVIEVEDTGIGIPEEKISQIFNPFYTTKGAVGGSKVTGIGLGLSLAEHLLHSMKGWFEVKSQLGKGTVIRIHLPKEMKDESRESGSIIRDIPEK
ncbi:MAG: PAS domain S-box protein [Planctomycetota bacterium]|nr:MAG: PAS domain S-box protein [Planctomycetota bacterium]